jgi:fructose-specific phosphotransferase system IIC component
MTARPRHPWTPALLSGLVFPGLGQLLSGHPWRAAFFGGSSAGLLAAVVVRVVRETERLLPDDAAALLDPALPFRLAVEVHRANATFFLWATAGIVALWLGSIADAWASSGGRRG